MAFKNSSLSIEDAEARVKQGHDILLSPQVLKTNETFQRMKEIADLFKGIDLNVIRRLLEELDPLEMDTTFLYQNLGSSADVCEVDLIHVVASCLDQTIKVLFRMDPSVYANLVGPNGPFTSTVGNSITYARLLLFVDRYPNSPMRSLCKELLDRAEVDFLTEFKLASSMGHPIPTISSMELRDEMRAFTACLLRRDRLLAAHLLSEVMYLDKSQALVQQDLSGQFHTLKHSNWSLRDPRTIFGVGMRVLVLEDMQKRFERGRLRHQGYIVPFIGIFLCKYFLEEKIPHSIRVTFGSLDVTFKKRGQEVASGHTFDLRAIKRALPAVP